MDIEKGRPDDRLDRLLRRWGGEQAVAGEEATLGGPPMPALQPAAPLLVRMSWVMAAAGLMFALAGVVFFLASGGQTGNEVRPSVATTQPIAPVAPAEDPRLAALLERDRSFQVELAERDRWHKVLRDELEAKHAKALAQLQADGAERIDQLNAAQAALAGAELSLKSSAQEVARLREQVDRLQAAAVADGQGRREQLTELQARLVESHRQSLARFQAVYLGGQGSLAGRQQAARRNRLVERYANIRGKIAEETTGRLADTLEVWLTRLDQVDIRSATAANDFARQVVAAKLPAAIEQVSALPDQPIEVLTWLLECQLVFSGVAAAG